MYALIMFQYEIDVLPRLLAAYCAFHSGTN